MEVSGRTLEVGAGACVVHTGDSVGTTWTFSIRVVLLTHQVGTVFAVMKYMYKLRMPHVEFLIHLDVRDRNFWYPPLKFLRKSGHPP